MTRKEDIARAAEAIRKEHSEFSFILGAQWADAHHAPPSLEESNQVWSAAHALWLRDAKFSDYPQASVAYYYAMATMQLLERRARK